MRTSAKSSGTSWMVSILYWLNRSHSHAKGRQVVFLRFKKSPIPYWHGASCPRRS